MNSVRFSSKLEISSGSYSLPIGSVGLRVRYTKRVLNAAPPSGDARLGGQGALASLMGKTGPCVVEIFLFPQGIVIVFNKI